MSNPPIPVPDPDAESLIFRAAFTRYFFTCTIAGQAWSLPIILSMELPFRNASDLIGGLGSPVLFAIITGAIISIVTIQFCPVVINENELRSTNAWGKSARVKISEISSVRRTHFLTLPYLKISTTHKKNVLWLPLFLSDLSGFRAAVAQFVEPENPLRIALEESNSKNQNAK